MKVPTAILVMICGALLGLQGWTLHEIVTLKVQMASMEARISRTIVSQ